MRQYTKFIYTLLAVWIGAGSLVAQNLSTTNAVPYNTAANLVNNVLMGQGVTALNVTSYGNAAQRGFFFNGGSNIGIDSGVCLTSGMISEITIAGAPFGTASNAWPNAAGQGAGDADLLSVAQSVPSMIGQSFNVTSTWDASIIQFDFVPLSDTVEFDYVFGSDEYLTWINTGYNDAFGFFISGPGINGTFSNSAINVATVPGTTPALPITISTIHCGLNASYFNCNTSASWGIGALCNSPSCSGTSGLAFNGYTTVMTAVLPVAACDTFHMKLAVADGNDKILDTGVFLEANSFTSTGMQISPAPSYNPYGADTALYEGCGDVDIYFVRADSTLAGGGLSYNITGSSTMGADYTQIPNCTWNSTLNRWDCDLIFAPGQDSAAISFQVFNDGLAEGIETLIIAIDDTIQLSCHSGDTINLTLLDQPILTINAVGATTLDCADDSATISTVIQNGLPPYTYTWSNGVTDSTQNVLPPQTTSYTVTVNDGCGQQWATDFVNVGVFNVPWSVTKIGDNQVISCIDPPVTIAPGVAFNDNIWHGEISYDWSTGSTDSSINVWSPVSTQYTLTVTRNCTGEQIVKTFNLIVENDSVETLTDDIPLENSVECPGDSISVAVSAYGGYPPYTYQWSVGSPTPTTTVYPMQTQVYYVTVHDQCALVDYVDSVKVEVPVPDPLQIFGIANDSVPCPGVKVHFGPAVPYGGFGWGYLFSWDNFETTTNITQKIIQEDEEFTIWLTDGCRADTTQLTVKGVIADHTDLDLILTGDTTICYGDSVQLVAQGVKGGGSYEYQWLDSPLVGGKPIVKPTAPRSYTVRMIDACDSIVIKSVYVDVSQVIADYDYEYIDDYIIEVQNNSWSNYTITGYEWEVEESGYYAVETNPIIPLPSGDPYNVLLTATDTNGCKNVARVVVEPEFHLYIPTGFTPNSDGINDTWTIGSRGIKEINIQVFNRWGTKVFSTTDKDFSWDGYYQGERLPMGIYTYDLHLFTEDDEYYERSGAVTILNDFQQR